MEIPRELMDLARAQTSAIRDRAWADIEDLHAEIERIARGGPDPEDECLLQKIAALVSLELCWRFSNRARMAQGILDDDD
jgi:hypothetical protein